MKAVVFDFDGVLADSEPLHLAAYQKVLGARGIELTRADYYANYLGYSDEELLRITSAGGTLGLSEPELDALLEEKTLHFDSLIQHRSVMYPSALACIERLAAEFPLGIASGALRHEIEMPLRRAGLDRHIRFIVAAGDTERSKPAPDPYARAAQLHGLPPAECVAIEDSRWGIESAKAAGLKCVAITNSYPASELATADAVIDSLEEFTAALIRGL